MSDMLEWGADWITGMVREHVSQTVTVTWTVSDVEYSETLSASLVDEAGRVLRNEVKSKVENTYFLFETSEVEEKAVPLFRGLRINWNSNLYEIVTVGSSLVSFNDAHKRGTVVATKHVSI